MCDVPVLSAAGDKVLGPSGWNPVTHATDVPDKTVTNKVTYRSAGNQIADDARNSYFASVLLFLLFSRLPLSANFLRLILLLLHLRLLPFFFFILILLTRTVGLLGSEKFKRSLRVAQNKTHNREVLSPRFVYPLVVSQELRCYATVIWLFAVYPVSFLENLI